ncbi:antA/AntB antirepressor family protein [Acidithiobacillus sp. HP-11]|uniref:antA/AntB antirepressor family protein n=1 Tax=Acidithiobacillus sp. HP-11 TaxID=2697656 RepID=UPI0018797F91|nr:antA/AntB antirepressor family protein [Acidithiobacillus sp. HP-11]MBE7567669.1 antA/AntB antirepressor family protein [Acidithiobacillus sp. HP-11]
MNSHTTLIPVTEGTIQGRAQQLCNARDLHDFLGVRWAFTNWIKHLITKYGFVEGVDFEVFAEKRKNPQEGGRPTDEYHLTIDMAKQLAMVQNNDRGRQARLYFIECERIVLEDLRRTPDLPSLDELPICMCLPEDVEIRCVGDDGSIKTGFKMDSWSNRREPRLVIGFETRRFNAMSDSEIDPPHPDIFGLPLWIEMRGREAFVWTPKKSTQDPETRVINLPHAKTLIIGLPGAIDGLIYERGYSVTPFLTRKYGPWS